MYSTMTAKQVLDREYLEMRCKILELAASFDRLERADGDVDSDRRRQLLIKGLHIVLSEEGNRAEQMQLLFSRDYDQSWREQFGLAITR